MSSRVGSSIMGDVTPSWVNESLGNCPSLGDTSAPVLRRLLFYSQCCLCFHQEGGKVEPTGVGGWTPCMNMELVFGGSFLAAEAYSLHAEWEGRMLLVLSHLTPEMDADPLPVALAWK